MSKLVINRNIRKTPLPRTGRVLDAVDSTSVSVSGGGSISGGGEGVTDHGQLTGVINIDDNYSSDEKAIHLTAYG